MIWGFFSPAHVLTIILAVVIICVLYFILKNKSEKVKLWTLGTLSTFGIIAIILELTLRGSPFEYLPLHLCSLNAIMLPVAVITRNKKINNLLLLWSLGALFAIILNSDVMSYKIFSFQFNTYYFPHVVEFGIPVLMFKLGLAEKDSSCIKSTMIITLAAYTIVHLINIALNKYFIAHNIFNKWGNLIQVNYMFSIEPNNPLLEVFRKIIPHDYWYMFLALPIVVIYLLVVYSKEIWNEKRLSEL